MKNPENSIVFYIILIMGLFRPGDVNAQLPANPIGSNPFSLQWKQVNSDHIQLIYPSDLDTSAFRANRIMQYLWEKDYRERGIKNMKLPILMHGLRVSPNGFVIVGPFRSEFWLIPPQFKSLTSYLDLLTIHEYRHVQQFSNADRGLSKVGKTLLGSWVWGGLFATALPRWYYEGDGVMAETSQTLGGRGRFPAFNMEYHVLTRNNTIYNYEKASAGSLKDLVPNWYSLGYQLVAYGRKKYGSELWDVIETDALAYRGLLYPFAKALKRKIGKSPKEFYNSAMEDLKNQWAYYDLGKMDQSLTINTQEKSTVINYSAPTIISNQRLACLKNGYNHINELVIFEKGREKKLADIGILIDGSMNTLSFGGTKLVWAEQGFHQRWRNETYSDIVYYDLSSRVKQKVTKRKRYFSPAMDHSGSWIATIRIDRDLSNHLCIIKVTDGQETQSLRFPILSELSYPSWVNKSQIAYIHTRNQQNEIRIFDIESGRDQSLTKMLDEHISHLKIGDDLNFLYFAKEEGEVQNIFRLDLQTREITQLTDVTIGAYQPTTLEDTLYYSELGLKGFDLKRTIIQPIRKIDQTRASKATGFYHEVVAELDGGNIIDKLPVADHEEKSYSRFSGLLNFHSLIPQWLPPELDLSLLSDNAFGTLSADLNVSYNYNEEEFLYGAGLRYAELYPILYTGYRIANRNAVFFNFSGLTDTSFVQAITVDHWQEKQWTTGVTLPYNFSGGSMLRNFNFSAGYQHSNIRLRDENFRVDLQRDTFATSTASIRSIGEVYSEPLADQTIHTLDLSFNLNLQKLRAIQHLRSRLGFSFAARYRANIGNQELGGNTLAARAFLYLPGISQNHSFSIEGMYVQERILSNYRYGDVFAYPRGYDLSLRRDNFMKVGFNYRFPIVYPDFAIGGFAFIKRLKGNLFFDYGRFGIDSFPFTPRSVNGNSFGFELGMDFRALRLLEIDLGVRYSYLTNLDLSHNGQQHQIDFFVISITE